METQPLVKDAAAKNPFFLRWLFLGLLLVAVVILSASTVFLAIALGNAENDPSPTPPPPPPGPPPPSGLHEDDFPINDPTEDWDISTNHTRKVEFDTTEGTWMSLDVSPSGDLLVFDLLGDIYTMESSGGAATLLIGGVSFDIQPRFSPSGNYLLFTSDRNGCDNIYVYSFLNQEIFPVTDENYRPVGNAVWGEDDSKIILCKWYAYTRTVAASTIWEFDVDAENVHPGRPIIGRASIAQQIGYEEPFYDHNTNTLYYSQNTMDSPNYYEYNKDAHKQIFVVKARNLGTNVTTTVASGNGGACRPIVSPDGLQLAYIHRTPTGSELILQDLATGNKISLAQQLSQDMQESYTPMGVYPHFSFDNSGGIFFWSKGSILRVDTANPQPTVVPFDVSVSLDLNPTGYTVQNLTDERSATFPVRSIREYSFFPQEDPLFHTFIFFSALGSIWRVQFNESAISNVVKLVSSEEKKVLCSSPTVSDDAREMAYATWDDHQYGNIETYSLFDQTTTVITTEKGRYGDAVYSFGGLKLLWNRKGADGLTGSLYALNTGVYVISRSSVSSSWGSPVFVTSSQIGNPAFSFNGHAILGRVGGSFVAYEENEDSGGYSRNTIAQSRYATDYSLSYDGDWIAFVEFNQVYVADGCTDGGIPLLTAIPKLTHLDKLMQTSLIGGRLPKWTEKYLTWNWAKSIFRVSLEQIEECGEQLEDPHCLRDKVEEVPIDLVVPNPAVTKEQESYIITNAQIATMDPNDGDEFVMPNGTIRIQNNVIEEVVDSADFDFGAWPDAVIYDAEQGLVTPGFIDVHAHFSAPSFKVQQNWEYIANLAYGVTTMHNPSSSTADVFHDAELVRSGKVIGPRIFSTGSILYGAESSGHFDCGNMEDARLGVERIRLYGGFSIKSYSLHCRSSRQMVLQAARERGMIVVLEEGMHFYWNINEIIDGHASMEHSLPVSPLYNDVTTLWGLSGTGMTPTLVVAFGGIQGENYIYNIDNVWEDAKLRRFTSDSSLRGRSMRREKAKFPDDYHHVDIAKDCVTLREKNTTIHVGAHGQMQGIAFHWELELLSHGGFTNYQLLRAATHDGATGIGIQGDLGSVSVGKLADLLVYPSGSSPLDDIRNSRDPTLVIKDGVVYESATMNQVFPENIPFVPGPIINNP